MHHLYWGRNSFQFDWGQDREIMTFDGGGIGYGGAIASVDATGAEKERLSFAPLHKY